MSASTTKKVCVRCFSHRLITGYVTPQTYLRAEGAEILDRSAQVRLVPYEDIRAVYFVREFDTEPETTQRKVFASRPKTDGLWVRMNFRDGEILEGVLPNNLLLIGEHGVTITPPGPNTNTQRIFVPRQALQEFTVLGVIGSPVRRRKPKRGEPSEDQMRLFEKGRSGDLKD